MDKTEKLPTDEYFEQQFGFEMNSYRGTEQEIIVMKALAYKWFQRGQASVVVHAKRMVIESTKSLDDLSEVLRGVGL